MGKILLDLRVHSGVPPLCPRLAYDDCCTDIRTHTASSTWYGYLLYLAAHQTPVAPALVAGPWVEAVWLGRAGRSHCPVVCCRLEGSGYVPPYLYPPPWAGPV